jgi:hypothetical protein
MKYLIEKRNKSLFPSHRTFFYCSVFSQNKVACKNKYICKKRESEEEEKIFVHHYISMSSNCAYLISFFGIRK